ncbi:hypothetical protein OAL64_00615 [bacterium]|nr:hypothetical protein [bacterium]
MPMPLGLMAQALPELSRARAASHYRTIANSSGKTRQVLRWLFSVFPEFTSMEKVMSNSANSWQVIGANVEIRRLSEFNFAVFNGSSWDSSVVNTIDASLLTFLVDAGPASLSEDELLRQTAFELDLNFDESFIKYGLEALKQMAEVGLICKDITLENQ